MCLRMTVCRFEDMAEYTLSPHTIIAATPHLLVSLSPYLPISLSPYLGIALLQDFEQYLLEHADDTFIDAYHCCLMQPARLLERRDSSEDRT